MTAILILSGLALILGELANRKAPAKDHVALEKLKPDEIDEGLIADASIDMNFGMYMEEYEGNKKTGTNHTTNLYYLILTGQESGEYWKYMGIKVPIADEKKMEDMAKATYNYEASDPIFYSGAINQMSEEEYQYFKDYFLQAGWNEERIEEYTLPYYINAGTPTAAAEFLGYMIPAFGVTAILAGIVTLIYVMAGGSVRRCQRKLEEAGFWEADIEYEYESAKLFCDKNDFCISKRLIFYIKGNTPHMILNDQITRVYRRSVAHRINGSRTGASYRLFIYQLDSKKRIGISVPDEQTGSKALQYISETVPGAVVEY